jgi:hypothetical protein
MGVENGDKIRRSLLVVLSFCVMAGWGLLFFALWQNRSDQTTAQFLIENWRVVFGLPFSTMGAFIVVALFRQSDAPVAFEGLGFKFQGSAGEVILWIICFLAIVASIHILAGDPPVVVKTTPLTLEIPGIFQPLG